MGLRTYLDRSGQGKAQFVTLAAFAASDPTWAQFEQGWDVTLASGFRPVPYFHFVEALGSRYQTPFARSLGWERKHVWDLAFKLIAYIAGFPKGDLTMHSCVIDMNAWRDLVSSGCKIPSEVELCNRYVSQYIVSLFAKKVLAANVGKEQFYLRTDQLMNFVFDRNEDFFAPFRCFVNRAKEEFVKDGLLAMWSFVDGVGEADMKLHPGLQAADILAWGINRENTSEEGDEGSQLANIMRQVIPSTSKEYGRDNLSKEFCGS